MRACQHGMHTPLMLASALPCVRAFMYVWHPPCEAGSKGGGVHIAAMWTRQSPSEMSCKLNYYQLEWRRQVPQCRG
jgi:hypothetical protein